MSNQDNPCRCGGTCRRCRAGNTWEAPGGASLLPTREELHPGALTAARDLLAALAEGSVVVVDPDRATAALAEVIVTLHQGATRETARGCVAVLDSAAARMASPTVAAALSAVADILCGGYGVRRAAPADGSAKP